MGTFFPKKLLSSPILHTVGYTYTLCFTDTVLSSLAEYNFLVSNSVCLILLSGIYLPYSRYLVKAKYDKKLNHHTISLWKPPSGHYYPYENFGCLNPRRVRFYILKISYLISCRSLFWWHPAKLVFLPPQTCQAIPLPGPLHMLFLQPGTLLPTHSHFWNHLHDELSTQKSPSCPFLPALISTKAHISSCHCLVYGCTSLLYGISTSHCRAIRISFTFSLTVAFNRAGRRCLMNTGWLLEEWIELIPCITAGKSPGLHPRTGLNPYLPLTSSVTRAKSFNFKKGNNRLLF